MSMRADKTVFIIGAGASREANLPTGDELKNKIVGFLDIRYEHGIKQISGDHLIVEALREYVNKNEGSTNINPYLQEARHIRDALPQEVSIDNFIDKQRGNAKLELCGKLAIVRSILEAEKDSRLSFKKVRINSGINYSSLKNTWYIPLFQLLTENCLKDDLKERFKAVTLIIFNYDRCIEHFLYYILQNQYRCSDKESAELVKEISIYHPYGDVGTLPWMGHTGDRNTINDFGEDISSNKLLSLSKKIKTFTEGMNPDSSDILEIHNNIKGANKFVFLGFAFNELNMKLLTPKYTTGSVYKSARKCFATTFGISDSDKNIVKQQIKDLLFNKLDVNMRKITCFELFNEYKRGLSF